ncbi:hypothetical protein [Caldivirga maquilingensis]|uniref:Roadblock/LC7 family protein n=1 Tax=Caldivirga maquilingensis (strain ATCC 700844 / DSM 13496 / JCM 10307 / IC-167) TaxID=397948 RepID=A8MBB7_CALMQ|nr:hypothetical protein [Caldivirga maquilingensis]ABW01207.1 hypothetical protein Cmaq_0361 [Caldivirga maquilingensis IC-167]
MSIINIVLIAAVVIVALVVILLAVRRGRRGGVKDSSSSTGNLSNINIRQNPGGQGMGTQQVDEQTSQSSVDSLRNELISRIEGLTLMISEINKRVSELATRQFTQQESPVMMISYAPSSLSEVRDMVNVDALALVDAVSHKVIERDGDYPFESLNDYVTMVSRDKLSYMSIVKDGVSIYVVPIVEDTLYSIIVSSKPLSNVDVNVIKRLVGNYASSR